LNRSGWALAVALLTVSAVPAAADTPTDAAGETQPASKKDLALEAKRLANESNSKARERNRKRWHRKLARLAGRQPDNVINIYNGWTHETLPVTAGKQAGKADAIPQPVIDRFFRCRWTNRTTNMDPRLFPTVVAAANHFGVERVLVISAHRSAKYNLMLQKKGRQVGRNSKHVLGKAIDIRLPTVSTKRLRAWAKSLQLGGVGFYPQSRMIHLDTAGIRYWEGD